MVKVLCYGHKDTGSTLVRVYPSVKQAFFIYFCVLNKYGLKFVFVFGLTGFVL